MARLSRQTYLLIPKKCSLPYAWDDTSADRKQLVICANGKEKRIDLMQIGKRDPLKLSLGIHVMAEGPMIVLKLFTETERVSKRRLSSSLKDNRGSMASLKSIDTIDSTNRKPMMDIHIHLEGIGLSLINQKLQELLYLSAKDVEWTFSESNLDRLYAIGIFFFNFEFIKFKKGLQWIQIDNQLPNAMDPIFLFPSILSKNETTKARPVIMASMCRSKDTSFGVDYYEWLTVLLQELSIVLDEEFLQKLIEFNDFPSLYDTKKPSLIPMGLSVSVPFKSFDEDSLLYFDRFLLHPVQFNVSFTKTQMEKIKNQRYFLIHLEMCIKNKLIK